MKIWFNEKHIKIQKSGEKYHIIKIHHEDLPYKEKLLSFETNNKLHHLHLFWKENDSMMHHHVLDQQKFVFHARNIVNKYHCQLGYFLIFTHAEFGKDNILEGNILTIGNLKMYKNGNLVTFAEKINPLLNIFFRISRGKTLFYVGYQNYVWNVSQKLFFNLETKNLNILASEEWVPEYEITEKNTALLKNVSFEGQFIKKINNATIEATAIFYEHQYILPYDHFTLENDTKSVFCLENHNLILVDKRKVTTPMDPIILKIIDHELCFFKESNIQIYFKKKDNSLTECLYEERLLMFIQMKSGSISQFEIYLTELNFLSFENGLWNESKTAKYFESIPFGQYILRMIDEDPTKSLGYGHFINFGYDRIELEMKPIHPESSLYFDIVTNKFYVQHKEMFIQNSHPNFVSGFTMELEHVSFEYYFLKTRHEIFKYGRIIDDGTSSTGILTWTSDQSLATPFELINYKNLGLFNIDSYKILFDCLKFPEEISDVVVEYQPLEQRRTICFSLNDELILNGRYFKINSEVMIQSKPFQVELSRLEFPIDREIIFFEDVKEFYANIYECFLYSVKNGLKQYYSIENDIVKKTNIKSTFQFHKIPIETDLPEEIYLPRVVGRPQGSLVIFEQMIGPRYYTILTKINKHQYIIRDADYIDMRPLYSSDLYFTCYPITNDRIGYIYVNRIGSNYQLHFYIQKLGLFGVIYKGWRDIPNTYNLFVGHFKTIPNHIFTVFQGTNTKPIM